MTHGLALLVLLALQASDGFTPDLQAPIEKPSSDRVDSYGDPLPRGAISRIGTARFHHRGVTCLAFSPDGKTLLSGGFDGAIRKWNPVTGQEDVEFLRRSGYRWHATTLAFSPDGLTFACEGKRSGPANLPRIGVYDALTGDMVRTLSVVKPAGIKWRVLSVAFAPDGKTLATAIGDNIAQVWDAESSKELLRLKGHEGRVSAVAFSPRGNWIATGGADGTVRLWDPAGGKEIRTLSGSSREVISLAAAPDGRTIAAAHHDQRLLIWDVRSGKRLFNIRQVGSGFRARGFQSVAFSPDGKRLASTAHDGTVRIWNVATEDPILKLEGHEDNATAVAFAPDGKTLASGSSFDGAIRLWDLPSGREKYPKHSMDITCLDFSPDGKKLVTGSRTGAPRMWEVATGKHLFRLDVPKTLAGMGTYDVRFSSDGRSVAAGMYCAALWNAATGENLHLWDVARDVYSVRFSRDGKVLYSGQSRGTRVYDTVTGNERKDLKSRGYVASLPDGRPIAYRVQSGSLHVWEFKTGKEILVLNVEGGIALSPDGALVAANGIGENIDLWQISTGQKRVTLPIKGRMVFSPDGRILATVGRYARARNRNRSVRLWEVTSGKELVHLRVEGESITTFAFSRDGQLMASGLRKRRTALIWSLPELLGVRRPEKDLDQGELERQWKKLEGEDSVEAWRSIWTLSSGGDKTVDFLSGRVREVEPSSDRVRRLIRDLDADEFDVRERASRELQASNSRGLLEKALEMNPPAEVHARIRSILRFYSQSPTPAIVRAIQVLERIGTKKARELLQSGPGVIRRTHDARKALERLGKGTR